jgi:hypothetical protein
VNGAFEVVGSDTQKVRSIVAHELETKPNASIALRSALHTGDGVHVTYDCTTGGKAPYVNFALVKTKAETTVKRGENSGKKLISYNIVMEFISKPLDDKKSGEIVIPFSNDKVTSDYSIVAYLQTGSSGKILAAAKIPIK